ncbi:MAG: alkyl/aryl-sulfatase [Alphaproteobacteria bacterium]|nr:alkyl/aryl-sulfatase [Alphaproteobacteria bacterium]
MHNRIRHNRIRHNRIRHNKIKHRIIIVIFFTLFGIIELAYPQRAQAEPVVHVASDKQGAPQAAPAAQADKQVFEAEQLLHRRSAEFNREIIKLTDNAYTAVGYGVSAISMVIGPNGYFLIDAGIDPAETKEALDEFAKLTDKPLRALLITHGHFDHFAGAQAILAAHPNIDIWAMENFGHENKFFTDAGLTIQGKRGALQSGFLLPREKRINNGIAKVYYPPKATEAWRNRTIPHPTKTINAPTRVIIAGLTVEMMPSPGETYDTMSIWLPQKSVLFAGDNFYKSWPNLYPIRGAAYRDVKLWIDALDALLAKRANVLVGGHTRPIIGRRKVQQILSDYRRGVASVFEQTIAGMNKGLTVDELVATVRLPSDLADKDFLRPYYGHPEWAVRSIYSGYLGWFDGNPTNLFPLSAKERAAEIASMLGGEAQLFAQLRLAQSQNKHQWTAELADMILALQPQNKQAMRAKADAYDKLGRALLTATGRNFYFSTAQQLRKQIGE